MHTACSLYLQKRHKVSVRPGRLLQDNGNSWIICIFEATMGPFLHLVGRVPNCFSLCSNFPSASETSQHLKLQANSLSLNACEMWSHHESLCGYFVCVWDVYCLCQFGIWDMEAWLTERLSEDFGCRADGGTPWLTSSASQAPGALLCVFLNGIFDWCFQLPLSAKGIEEKGGLANINEILMEGLFNNIKMWIWGVSQLVWGS